MSKVLEWFKVTFEYDEEEGAEKVLDIEEVGMQPDGNDLGTDCIYINNGDTATALPAVMTTDVVDNTVCLAFYEGDIDYIKNKSEDTGANIYYSHC